MTAWLVAIAAGIVMYLLRGAVPLLLSGRELPERMVRVSRLVAPAVVGALLAGSLALAAAAGPADILARLAVLGAAFAVALKTQSLPLTVGAGLAAQLLLEVLT